MTAEDIQDDNLLRLSQVRLLAMDVDGVLTDGTIVYDSNGQEHKRFHVADGLGIVVLLQNGFEVAWISGRANSAVERRGRELGVVHIVQGVRNKQEALKRLSEELAILPEAIAYIGDDWNDLPALLQAGVPIAVANAVEEVKAVSALVTVRSGGEGAVREVCELLMTAHGLRTSGLQRYLQSLESAADTSNLPGFSGQ